MHHPLVGELTFDFRLLQTVDSEHLRLMMYMPSSNSGTAEKIERLLAFESDMPTVRHDFVKGHHF